MADIPNQNNPVAKPPTPKKPNFQSYVDPTHEFESKDLGRAMWLARHKPDFYKIFFILMILVAVVTWGYVLFAAGNYLIFGYSQDKQLTAESTRFINYTPLKQLYGPADLKISDLLLLPSGTSKVDAVAQVENPNQRWLALVTYHFLSNSPSSTSYKGVALPGQTTLFTALGQTTDIQNATIAIDDKRWQRIDNHKIPDINTWLHDHLNFVVTDFAYVGAGTDPAAPAAASVRFTFSNDTAYSYRAPRFLVGLYRSQSLVGVLPLEFDSFRSQESKPVDLRLFTQNNSVDSVQVFVLFNIFDDTNYLPPAQ